MNDADDGPLATDLFLDNRYFELSSIYDPKDVRMREVSGVERLGEPFRYEITVISRQPIRDLTRPLGTRMTVGLKLKNGGDRYFNGIVTSFRFIGIDETRRTNYVADVRSWLTLLDYRQNCRVFESKTALDIIQAIFAEHPVARYRNATLGREMRIRPLTVQWNETDLAFVSRLMEQEGIYYYFEHDKSSHNLILVDDPSVLQPCPVDDKIETHLNLERAQIHNDMIYKWQEVATLQPDIVTLDDYDYEKPQTKLRVIEPVPLDAGPPAGEGELEIYHWPGDHRCIEDGSNYARIRAQEFASRRSRIWLDTNARHLVPGHTFQAGNPYDRTNLMLDPTTDSRYVLLGGEFTIVGETGIARRSSDAHFLFSGRMEALLATTQYRPPKRTPRPVIAGPQTAIVVGPGGQDIETDRYGCVKVRFFWDRNGADATNGSCFLRVAQSWAGRGWGGLVTPRIGQEVVVQFINGDPDWPIVTGAVYNDANLPPYDLPAEATRSTFKSRSSDGSAAEYNELRFEDRVGREEVYLRAQKDFNGEVLNDMAITTGSRAKVTAKASTRIEAASVPNSPMGSSVELDSTGLITATGNLNIWLKVGPGETPLAQVLINATGVTLMGPTINLVSEDGEINMSGPPIFPPD